MKPSVAILIVFFNKVEQTIECIESFLPSGFPIYVLNNGSDKDQYKRLNKRYMGQDHIRMYSSEVNVGPAVARNYLIKNSKEEWLFFVDNDITISPTSWSTIFEDALYKNPVADVFLPSLWNVHDEMMATHPLFILESNTIKLIHENRRTNYFPSGAAMVNRSVFDRHGYFDDQLFAFEDYEFGIRLLKNGEALNIVELHEVQLNHNHIFQKKRKDKKAVRERYNEVRLANSFQLIEKKHSIIFDHEWRWWVNNQRSKMAGKSLWKRIVNKLNARIKR